MVLTLPVSEHQIVALRGGLAVPAAALRILWGLEARDFGVSLADDGVLLVSPASKLTAVDRHDITQHREALRTLVRYCDRMASRRSRLSMQEGSRFHGNGGSNDACDGAVRAQVLGGPIP